MKKVLFGLLMVLLLVGCTETVEERVIPTGDSVSAIDKMKAENANLPVIGAVTVDKPYDFDEGNEPTVEDTVVVADSKAIPLEYAPKVAQQKEDARYEVATGAVEILMHDVHTTYETIRFLTFDFINGMSQDIDNPIMQVVVDDIVLKEHPFQRIGRGEVLSREQFPTKARIGEGEKIVVFKIGEYINNSFVEYGSTKRKVLAE